MAIALAFCGTGEARPVLEPLSQMPAVTHLARHTFPRSKLNANVFTERGSASSSRLYQLPCKSCGERSRALRKQQTKFCEGKRGTKL